MARIAEILSVEDDLLRLYLFYSCVLILKMMLMILLTAIQRFKHKAFINPEDAVILKLKPKVDENVERVRRAHLNDLENIPLFFLASFAYIMTGPSLETATLLFRVFAAARFMHTFVYAVYVVPQPARAVAFEIGTVIILYMIIRSFIYFM